MMPVTSGDGNC